MHFKDRNARGLKEINIKVIDFGAAVVPPEMFVRTTRQYRSPEQIMGIRFSFPIDAWSLG